MDRSFGETPPQPGAATALHICPPPFPSHPARCPAQGLSPGSRHCWLLTLLHFGVIKHTCSRAGHVPQPFHQQPQLESYCKAGVLLWHTLNSCLLQEKGNCVWVNRFKPNVFKPKPRSSLMLQCQDVSQEFVLHSPLHQPMMQCSLSWCSQSFTVAAAALQNIPEHKWFGYVLHINNSSPGAVSPMTTEKTEVMFVNKTTEREEFHG